MRRVLANNPVQPVTKGLSSLSRAAWVPEDAAGLHRVTTAAMEKDLLEHYQNAAKGVVSWFAGHMPPAYFRETCMKSGLAHMKSIPQRPDAPNFSISEARCTADLGNGVTELSFVQPGDVANTAQSLQRLLADLPSDIRDKLQRIKVFTSSDDRLHIFTFTYGPLMEPSASLVDYLRQFSVDSQMENMPIKLRFTNPENINHFVTLRHRQCRLSEGKNSAGPHHSIFVERRGSEGSKPGKFNFYCSFTGLSPASLAERTAKKIIEDGFVLRNFHLDAIKEEAPHEPLTNLLFLDAHSPVDLANGSPDASWRAAQDLRWRLQTELVEDYIKGDDDKEQLEMAA